MDDATRTPRNNSQLDSDQGDASGGATDLQELQKRSDFVGLR